MSEQHSLFRALPSMNAVLEALIGPADGPPDKKGRGRGTLLCAALPRPLVRESVEDFLQQCRAAIAAGAVRDKEELALPVLLPRITAYVEEACRPHFRRVINATGVVIHTNLGRSPLAPEAIEAVTEAAGAYSNLEFNLATGARGSRYSHVENLIRRLTGAEAALAVNNNAAAVLLTLDSLCKGREVVVSRGELVEIGGSFRIPEVMEKSGCILKEVGATNRTHLKDYAAAIREGTAALMKVHSSNFRIIGFTSVPAREELSALAKRHTLPLIEDLGSGALIDFAAAGLHALAAEPAAAQVLAAGVDVVTFSGDKVLGGPQAGIIAGKAEYIERIKRNPLNRALRIDKLTLAALEATLRLYCDPALALRRIPALRMISEGAESIRPRARKLAALLKKTLAPFDCSLTLRPGASRTGGGAFPELDLPTWLVCLALRGQSPDSLRSALLRSTPPVVARIEDNELCFDPRTLDSSEYPLLAKALEQALHA